MKKIYLALTCLLFIASFLSPGISRAQTTICTTHLSNNGNAMVTFNVQNTNNFPIIITDIKAMIYGGAGGTATWTLLSNPTAIASSGATWTQGVIGVGQNGWVLAGTASITLPAQTGPLTVLSGLTVTVPALTTWGFCLTSSATISYESLAAGNYSFPGGGVNILTGNNISWGGAALPTTPVNYPRGWLGCIVWVPGIQCSGKPTAGTINPVNACPNQNFNLTLNMPPNQGGGLTYDWQFRVGSGPWTSFASTPTATGNINTPTDYRCIVGCSNSPGPANLDTTPVYTAQLSNFLYCYCNPVYTINGPTDNIVNVHLGVLNNNSASAGNNLPCWSNYTTQQPTPIPIPFITIGTNDMVDVTVGTDIDQYCGVWIDYNRNGLFETSEYSTLSTNAGANGIAHIPLTIPPNASAGLTRMRIRAGDDVQMNASQACGPTNSNYGEAEDYLVEIRYPNCGGPADAGLAHVTDTAMCPGYYFKLTDTTHTKNAYGLQWSWQASITSGNIWNDLPGTVNRDTITLMFTNTTWYRLRIICAITGDTTYSNIIKINIKPPYKCYCYSIATGGSQDTSDIGSFSLSNVVTNSGGPHLGNPAAIRGRTDYTDYGPIILYSDSTYEVDIFHTMPGMNPADARVTMFIDYNNNLQYDIPEEAIYLTTQNPATDWISTNNNGWYLTNNISIPHAVIPNAPTGLRVIINNDLQYNIPSDMACGPYTSGETEDYVVMFKRKENESVATIKGLNDLAVYPNPNNGVFSVSFRTASLIKHTVITVTDITGRVLSQEAFDNVNGNFKQEFDLSSHAHGVYFVEINADGQKQTSKIVIR